MKDKTVFWLSFLAALSVLFAAGTIAYGLFMTPLADKHEPAAQAMGAIGIPDDLTLLLCAAKDSRTLPTQFALVNFDPQNSRVTVTNLPPDFQVSFGTRSDTLDQCYGYGGILQVKKSLQQKNMPIDYYAATTLEHVGNIVDALGPFSFCVPKDIYAYDQQLRLLFKQPAGDFLLGGTQLCGILKYIDLSPQEFTALWLDLLKALLSLYMTPDNARDLSALFASIADGLTTNINTANIPVLQKNMTALTAVGSVTFSAPQNFDTADLYQTLDTYF